MVKHRARETGLVQFLGAGEDKFGESWAETPPSEMPKKGVGERPQKGPGIEDEKGNHQ